MDMAAQLNAVNPYPEVGGKNAWHPPSRQVRFLEPSVGAGLYVVPKGV